MQLHDLPSEIISMYYGFGGQLLGTGHRCRKFASYGCFFYFSNKEWFDQINYYCRLKRYNGPPIPGSPISFLRITHTAPTTE